MANKTIFGIHAVMARLRQQPASIKELLVQRDRRDERMRQLLSLAEQQDCRVVFVDDARLDGAVGGSRHQGVVALVDASYQAPHLEDILDTLTDDAFLLVLDGIQDPHNLGACLRVADAMGVHAVIAPKDRAVGLTAVAAKVACGAADTVPYITVTNLARTLRNLQSRGITLVGAAGDEGSAPLFDTPLTGSIAWVMGAEGDGLRRLTRETCDLLVAIPMFGSVESLNVSVATGICLAETRRQRLVQVKK